MCIEEKMKVKKGYCPVAIYSYGVIAQRYNKLVLLDSELSREEEILRLPRNFFHKVLMYFRPFQRLFRMNIRAAKIFKNKLVFSDMGYLYVYDFNTKVISKICSYRQGMRSPLEFTIVYGKDKTEKYICYGEYFSNNDRESVNIFKSNDGLIWEKAYTFPEKAIRHIHNIVQDKFRDRLIVLTGDLDSESGFWESTDGLKTILPIKSGSQKYRACQMFFTKEESYYVTDSEYKINQVYVTGDYSYNELVAIQDIPGSVINGICNERNFFFSTTVEPTKGGIVGNLVKIFQIDTYGSIKKMYEFTKDRWPFVFQYGTVRLFLDDKYLYMYPIAVKQYDNCLIRIKEEELDEMVI